MKLTVLGSGGIHPDLSRNGPAHLVRAGEACLLLEAGPGATRGLLRAGVRTWQLDGVCLTHRHPDHLAELPILLELEKAYGRTRPLALAGPPALADLLAFLEGFGRPVAEPLPFPVELTPLPGRLRLGPFEIEGLPVAHVPQAVGLRVRAGGRLLAFTGDSGPCAGLVDLARGADLLLCECSLPTGTTLPQHLAPEQVAELAREAGCARVVLTHFPPDADPAEAVAACRARGVEARAAYDGLTLDV